MTCTLQHAWHRNKRSPALVQEAGIDLSCDLSLTDFLRISKIVHLKEIETQVFFLCAFTNKKETNMLQEMNFDIQEASAFSVMVR